MRTLSLAVAAFALAALLVGLRSPDIAIFLYAGAALLCAGATYRSARISAFLRVFEVVFAVETILFGAAFLLDVLGLWPQAYADYRLPSSLPLTVALFGSLVYAVSFIPVVRTMTDIADPYFFERAPTSARVWPGAAFTVAQNRLAIAAVVFLIVINQLEVALLFRLNYFSRDFYNAMQEQERGRVLAPTAVRSSCRSPTAYIAALVVEYVVTSTFVYRWRRWLSAHYIGRWLGGGAHYPMALAGTPADNPDQRICEDIYGFIYGGGRPRRRHLRLFDHAAVDPDAPGLLRHRAVGAVGRSSLSPASPSSCRACCSGSRSSTPRSAPGSPIGSAIR